MHRNSSSDLGFSAAQKSESELEVLQAAAERGIAPRKADAYANAVHISITSFAHRWIFMMQWQK